MSPSDREAARAARAQAVALEAAQLRVDAALRELRDAWDALRALEGTPPPSELIKRVEAVLRNSGADPDDGYPWLARWWTRPAEELSRERPVDLWRRDDPALRAAVREQLELDMLPREGYG